MREPHSANIIIIMLRYGWLFIPWREGICVKPPTASVLVGFQYLVSDIEVIIRFVQIIKNQGSEHASDSGPDNTHFESGTIADLEAVLGVCVSNWQKRVFIRAFGGLQYLALAFVLCFVYIPQYLLHFEILQERREWRGPPIEHEEIACEEEQREDPDFGRWGQPS